MRDRALAMFLRGNQAYEVVQHDRSERVDRVLTFPRAGDGADENAILDSGWLLGEERISEKTAMVAVDHGQCSAVLIGLPPQHRAQTYGTVKLVFNALVGGP